LAETRWQRFVKRWKRKLPPEKRIKNYRQVAILYGVIGVVCIGLAVLFAYQLATAYKSSELVLPKLEWYNAISLIALISIMSGTFLMFAGFFLVMSLWIYSQSLELRIKELEKKLEYVEIEQGAES
jgi:hypothetical protein